MIDVCGDCKHLKYNKNNYHVYCDICNKEVGMNCIACDDFEECINKVNTELWKPIIEEYPNDVRRYDRSETQSFLDYQPISERYEIAGFMPKQQK